ncbi:hypothetical protein V1290_005750 [Bradyrhizobium sp. AZCC 1578]
MSLRNSHSRHCEERSDEAIHISACGAMDCFAALAMTEETSGDNGYFIARGGTPTPALPASGRGAQRSLGHFLRFTSESAASSRYPLPLAGEGGARVSARRVGARATHSLPDESEGRAVRNDNKITEDTK